LEECEPLRTVEKCKCHAMGPWSTHSSASMFFSQAGGNFLAPAGTGIFRDVNRLFMTSLKDRNCNDYSLIIPLGDKSSIWGVPLGTPLADNRHFYECLFYYSPGAVAGHWTIQPPDASFGGFLIVPGLRIRVLHFNAEFGINDSIYQTTSRYIRRNACCPPPIIADCDQMRDPSRIHSKVL
jgi:hypothetical protein